MNTEPGGADRPTHRWFQDRVLPHILGLLTEPETALFNAHLEACPECRTAVQELEEAESSDDAGSREGHIPSHLLADWSGAGSRLIGLERELVAEHLGACGECREVLRLMGQRPELLPAVSVTGRTGRILRPDFKMNRLGMVLAMAATVALAALVWRLTPRPGDQFVEEKPKPAPTGVIEPDRGPRSVPPESTQPDSGAEPRPTTPEAPPQAHQDLLAELTTEQAGQSPADLLLDVSELVRGEDAGAVGDITKSTRTVAIRLVPFFAVSGSTVNVSLLTPDSLNVKPLSEVLEKTVNELTIRLAVPSALKAGSYQLRISVLEPNGETYEESRFFELTQTSH